MTAFLIWLRNKVAALLDRPAAAIININHPLHAAEVKSAAQSAEAFATCATPRPEGFLGSKEHGLTAGQEVRLNSCDVWMTVLYADCCEADCAWFDGHTMHQDTFPLACLTATPPMPF